MDDLELLARLRPETENPDPVVLARQRIALLDRAAEPDARTAPRRRPLPRWAGGVAAVAGVTALGLVIGLSGGQTGPGTALHPGSGTVTGTRPTGSFAPQTKAAVTLLANAADAAANAPAGHGDWTYTSQVTVLHDAGIRTFTTTVWAKVDGTRSLIRDERDGKVQQQWSDGGAGGDGSPPSLTNATYRYLTTLPTDPTRLRAEIYRQARNEVREMGPGAEKLYTVDQWAYQMIGTLVESAVPPGLEAALYRVAATVPGVQYVDDVTDASGRHGIGVAHTVNSAGDRTVLIFDRRTYRVLGTAGSVHDGRADSTAVLAAGLVDAPGRTP